MVPRFIVVTKFFVGFALAIGLQGVSAVLASLSAEVTHLWCLINIVMVIEIAWEEYNFTRL